MHAISETGPWSVCVWSNESEEKEVVLLSDDFTHDVALYITGDFSDHEQKLKYANRLASRMNRMPKE